LNVSNSVSVKAAVDQFCRTELCESVTPT